MEEGEGGILACVDAEVVHHYERKNRLMGFTWKRIRVICSVLHVKRVFIYNPAGSRSKAKSRDKALVLSDKATSRKRTTRSDRGAEVRATEVSVPATAPHFRLTCGDAVEWLQTLPSVSVDLIITDPPYESLEKHRAIGTTTRLKQSKASSNEWFTIFPNGRFQELFRECWRVLKPNTHFYLFCDAETMFVAKPIAEAIGFKFWKPLVWDKKKIGMGYHYRSRHEFILFFEKGKRKLSNLSIPDIIEVPRIIGGYPTEKPADVSKVLVTQSSANGGRVVDPFMGAGSVGVAAVTMGRNFYGNDLSTKALDIARERLIMAGGVDDVGVDLSAKRFELAANKMSGRNGTE
jgi:site-specific DNA-methyltransferase (adenine-specific)